VQNSLADDFARFIANNHVGRSDFAVVRVAGFLEIRVEGIHFLI